MGHVWRMMLGNIKCRRKVEECTVGWKMWWSRFCFCCFLFYFYLIIYLGVLTFCYQNKSPYLSQCKPLSLPVPILINIYCRHYTHIFLGNTLCPQDRESAKCVCLLAWVWLTYLSLQPSGTPAKDLTTAAAKMALKWVCVLCVYASVFFNIHTQAISARSICLNSKLQHTRCQSWKNKKYTYPVK